MIARNTPTEIQHLLRGLQLPRASRRVPAVSLPAVGTRPRRALPCSVGVSPSTMDQPWRAPWRAPGGSRATHHRRRRAARILGLAGAVGRVGPWPRQMPIFVATETASIPRPSPPSPGGGAAALRARRRMRVWRGLGGAVALVDVVEVGRPRRLSASWARATGGRGRPGFSMACCTAIRHCRLDGEVLPLDEEVAEVGNGGAR